MLRRRSTPYTSNQNIADQKAKLSAQIADMPYGPEREKLERKISQLDTAAHMNDWLARGIEEANLNQFRVRRLSECDISSTIAAANHTQNETSERNEF